MFERKCKNKLNFLFFFSLPLFYSLFYKDCVVMSLMWSFTPFSAQLKLRYEGFCRMVIAERASVIWRMPVRDILLQICHITGLVAKAGIIMSLPSVNNFICIRYSLSIDFYTALFCLRFYVRLLLYLFRFVPSSSFAFVHYIGLFRFFECFFFFQIFFLSLVVVVLYFILLRIVFFFSEILNFMVFLFPSVFYFNFLVYSYIFIYPSIVSFCIISFFL